MVSSCSLSYPISSVPISSGGNTTPILRSGGFREADATARASRAGHMTRSQLSIHLACEIHPWREATLNSLLKLLSIKHVLSCWGAELVRCKPGAAGTLAISTFTRGEPVGERSQRMGGKKKWRNSFLMTSSEPLVQPNYVSQSILFCLKPIWTSFWETYNQQYLDKYRNEGAMC